MSTIIITFCTVTLVTYIVLQHVLFSSYSDIYAVKMMTVVEAKIKGVAAMTKPWDIRNLKFRVNQTMTDLVVRI